MEKRLQQLGESTINISLGWSWAEDSTARPKIQHEAEQMMYQRKAQYYQLHDRRRR